MPVQQQLVAIDLKRHALGGSVKGAFDLVVAEGDYLPAAVANQVIMVAGSALDGLIAGEAAPDADSPDKAEAVQLVEDAVDAGACDPPV